MKKGSVLAMLMCKAIHQQMLKYIIEFSASADPEGGQKVRAPPGKSQVIWVSIWNKQLDPPPGKSWTPPPPPPLENVGPSLKP